MARLSISETTTFRWSFEEDVLQYRAAGVPALGVWRQKLSDFGEAKAVELLAETGVAASHLAWAGGFTGSDGRSFRESVSDAQDAVRTAAELRAPTLVVYSGGRAGHTHNHARRLIKDALREVAPLAEALHVALAIEPMHPGCCRDWTFLTSVADVLSLIESVGSPACKMVFDTYHLGLEAGIVEQIADLAPHVALVQLGDARRAPEDEQNRCRLGEGIVPLAEIVQAFSAAGYDGYYDVELLGEEIEASDYHALLEHSKQAFDRLTG